MKQWYYEKDGGKEGPVPERELETLIRQDVGAGVSPIT